MRSIRSRKIVLGAIALLFVPFFALPALSADKAASPAKQRALDLSDAFADAAARVGPAVVHIQAERKVGAQVKQLFQGPRSREFFRGPQGKDLEELLKKFMPEGQQLPNIPHQYRPKSTGSGIIVDGKGHILTNNHVVEDAVKLTVTTSEGKEYKAEVVGTDKITDLAVIKIDNGSTPYAQFGDSEHLRIGEWVIAIGSPFGFQRTVTAGIVSATGRGSLGLATQENWIQTDAAINPGNSGGPLVNLDGEVIGINTAISTRSGGYDGIGFAIPVDMVRHVMNQIITTGKVTRAFLGVGIQAVSFEMAETLGRDTTEGAMVSEIHPDTPAQRAGIRIGDVIVEFDGKKIEGSGYLQRVVGNTPVGKHVKVVVLREGKRVTLEADLGEASEEMLLSRGPSAPGQEPEETTDEALGMQLQDLTEELAEELGYAGATGIVVTEIEEASLAYDAGIRQGDLITHLGQKPVENLAEFREKISKMKPNQNLMLRVKNSKGTTFLVLQRD
jgi:serine protease Do